MSDLNKNIKNKINSKVYSRAWNKVWTIVKAPLMGKIKIYMRNQNVEQTLASIKSNLRREFNG